MSATAHPPDEDLLLLAPDGAAEDAHSLECPYCRDRLLELRRTLDVLTPPAVPPSPEVWAAISRSVRVRPQLVAAGLACLLLLPALSVLGTGLAPVAAVATLHGTLLASGALARVYAPSSGDFVFVAVGLPSPGPGRVYELWSIHGSTHVPVAVFRPGRNGEVLLRMPSNLVASAYGVTLESSPGSARPSGSRVLEETSTGR